MIVIQELVTGAQRKINAFAELAWNAQRNNFVIKECVRI
jgi:hypothetical protein